ncbi:MAG: DNA alkylation repair protein [Pseudomonadota bacterium]|nr:DNA alkylation repair protein [Pseudomonadota bacterium]
MQEVKNMPTKTKAAGKPKAPRARMPLGDVMTELEAAGSEQTRKTYARHGAQQPMFGVSFATLKTLYKRIGVDHELASALWETSNFDARNLAVKVVDPSRLSEADLDSWARASRVQMVLGYVAHVTVETPYALGRATAWLATPSERAVGWMLVGAMALRDETTPDAWFADRLGEIESSVHSAPNAERGPMNHALIAIGSRNAPLRELASAAAKRIGPVEVDHGDTACETIDPGPRIEKTWAHSTSKGFASPAAHERSRESMRTRC